MRVLALCVLLLASPPPAVAPARPGDAGYWLSAELLGPAAARGQALARLRGSFGEATATTPAELTGEVVTHVPDMASALRWVEEHSFGDAAERDEIDPLALRSSPAAIPGAALRSELGVHLRALAVSGQTPLGERRAVDWPEDPASILPPDSRWVPADLVPAAAPIFAAPAPAIPPASERFATIHRRGYLFVVRTIDRCDSGGSRPAGAEGRCLRWAQVVARDDDRFIPGFVPAFQVAPRGGWVRGEGELPRAILQRSGVDGQRARYQLLARARDDTVHRTTITAAMNSDAFPDASVTIAGDVATVIAGREPEQRFALDASLDARATPHSTAAAGDPPAADAPSPPRSEER